MSYTPDQQAIINEAAKTSALAFENQTSDNIAANFVAKAHDLAATHALEAAKLGPSVSVHNIDGTPTVFGHTPISRTRNVAEIVSPEEYAAMGGDVERWPDCALRAVGHCDSAPGAGRYKITSESGKPMSINRKGELVFGTIQPLHEVPMTRADRARAEMQSIGIDIGLGPSGGVPAAQLVASSGLDVCLAHSFRGGIPLAPAAAPPKLYITGPYAGHFTANRRAHAVNSRTRGTAEVVNARDTAGKDKFYVRGDDGIGDFKGEKVEI